MQQLFIFLSFPLTSTFYACYCFNRNITAITNVSQWQGTDDSPPREIQELDFDLCAVLYKHILKLGWIGPGRNLADLYRRCWWEFYETAAENVRHRLAPSVIEFLKIVQVGIADLQWCWHCYLRDLSYRD